MINNYLNLIFQYSPIQILILTFNVQGESHKNNIYSPNIKIAPPDHYHDYEIKRAPLVAPFDPYYRS